MPYRNPMKRRNRELMIFVAGLLVGVFSSSCIFIYCLSNTHDLANSAVESATSHGYSPIQPSVFHNSIISVPHFTDGGGWKTIHVFFGNKAHLADVTSLPSPYFQANKWFSQFRQDEIISCLFREKRGGYFVDLAANDAVRISNTYALETYFDWDGLCLEPNAMYWNGLSFRKCHIVAAVVGNTTMDEIEFQFPRDKAPKGGIVGAEFDNKQVKAGETQRRFTIRLLDIFRRFQVPSVIDFLSLDVEGAEDLVLSSFPFHDYRFLALTIERPSDKLAGLLMSQGYTLLKAIKSRTETLWVHESVGHQLNVVDALKIDSDNYKYRETSNQERIAPERVGL